jgi:hypothetical protein
MAAGPVFRFHRHTRRSQEGGGGKGWKKAFLSRADVYKLLDLRECVTVTTSPIDQFLEHLTTQYIHTVLFQQQQYVAALLHLMVKYS